MKDYRDTLIAAAFVIVALAVGMYVGAATSTQNESERWQRRLRETGFSVVTRYDVMTGEPKQVVLKLETLEAAP